MDTARRSTNARYLPFAAPFCVVVWYALLSLHAASWAQAINTSPPRAPAAAALTQSIRRPGYVGDEACRACHREQSLSFSSTGHRLTSQLANRQTVLGNFHPGSNELTISDRKANPALPELLFRMESKNDGLYETAITGWDNRLLTTSGRIDLITGSGVRGQTYLSWQGDRLSELPVSYWTDGHRWINSPGYIDGTANFFRPVNPGCLECHASYIRPLSSDPSTNSYERESLVPGLSCETCHGPGAEHAARYANRPSPPTGAAAAILNPASFPRDRQVDACAVCHSGTQREALAPAYSFVPGRPLSDYFKPMSADPLAHPDVHGNQVGLLQRSHCYQSSSEMSCSTCHDVHGPEKTAASYSARCLTCHQWTSCPVSKRLGQKIAENCIDCHMPVEATNVIVSETAGAVVRAKLRNHWIKVYPEPQGR